MITKFQLFSKANNFFWQYLIPTLMISSDKRKFSEKKRIYTKTFFEFRTFFAVLLVEIPILRACGGFANVTRSRCEA